MDEFQPPNELTDLWLGPPRPPEDATAITQRVLREARQYGSNISHFDGMGIGVSIVLVLMLLVVGLAMGDYLVWALMIAFFLFQLTVYRMHYRLAPVEPDSAAAPAREHVGYWLDWLRRRARYHRISAWGSVCMFGGAGARLRSGALEPERLGTAALFLLAGAFGLWCTWYELRRLARRQANLQRILDDLESGPGTPR